LSLARERPEIGQFRAARELRERGIQLSPSGVRNIWKRHGLETAYQRLMERERAGGSRAPALNEGQRALLKRARVSRRIFSGTNGEVDSSGGVRREHLISAAARVFSEKGYEGASLREICAAAGILPGSLYYHFRSKEDLFVTVHSEGFGQLSEGVDRAIATESDSWRRLEAACAEHLKQLVNGNDIALVAAKSQYRTARPAVQRRLDRDREAYERRFRDLMEALDLPADVDRSLLRLALLGALNWTQIWYRPGKKTPAEIAHHLIQKIIRH
jgi:AcrR family transcriptional regulator